MMKVNSGSSNNVSSSNANYTVRSGDTLSEIARNHGVSLSSLIKANPQISNPNIIHSGQHIHVPSARSTGSVGGQRVSQGNTPSDRPAHRGSSGSNYTVR